MITSAAELFQAAALRTKTVTVLGHEVTIRELSVSGRLKLADVQPKEAAVVLVRECLIAPDGKPILSKEDAERLYESSAEFVDGIGAEILKFSKPADEKKG